MALGPKHGSPSIEDGSLGSGFPPVRGNQWSPEPDDHGIEGTRTTSVAVENGEKCAVDVESINITGQTMLLRAVARDLEGVPSRSRRNGRDVSPAPRRGSRAFEPPRLVPLPSIGMSTTQPAGAGVPVRKTGPCRVAIALPRRSSTSPHHTGSSGGGSDYNMMHVEYRPSNERGGVLDEWIERGTGLTPAPAHVRLEHEGIGEANDRA